MENDDEILKLCELKGGSDMKHGVAAGSRCEWKPTGHDHAGEACCSPLATSAVSASEDAKTKVPPTRFQKYACCCRAGGGSGTSPPPFVTCISWEETELH